MTINYTITVISNDNQDILFRASGTREDYSTPTYMMNELGHRYVDSTVIYHDLTNGFKVEKSFE